jgi:hypothetical protein
MKHSLNTWCLKRQSVVNNNHGVQHPGKALHTTYSQAKPCMKTRNLSSKSVQFLTIYRVFANGSVLKNRTGKCDHMVYCRAYAYPLTNLVVMVRRHVGQHLFASLQTQGVQKL